MKIIALPDLHSDVGRLQLIGTALSAVDLVLLVGDFTYGGSASDVERMIDALRGFNPRNAVPFLKYLSFCNTGFLRRLRSTWQGA